MKINTIALTSIRRNNNNSGLWVKGQGVGYRFCALVFKDRADLPEWEIGESGISKLWISRNEIPVFNWDRGLDFHRGDAYTEFVLKLIVEKLPGEVHHYFE